MEYRREWIQRVRTADCPEVLAKALLALEAALRPQLALMQPQWDPTNKPGKGALSAFLSSSCTVAGIILMFILMASIEQSNNAHQGMVCIGSPAVVHLP